MSEIYTESMTRYCYRLSLKRFYFIRMWRQEKEYNETSSEETRDEAIFILDELNKEAQKRTGEVERKADNMHTMAVRLLRMERMNAVEVVDEDGNGVVLYKDWP